MIRGRVNMPNMSYSNDLSFQWHPMTSLIKRFWEAWKQFSRASAGNLLFRWTCLSIRECFKAHISNPVFQDLPSCVLAFLFDSKVHISFLITCYYQRLQNVHFLTSISFVAKKMKHTLRPTSCRVRSSLFLFIQLPLSFATALLHLNNPSCLDDTPA